MNIPTPHINAREGEIAETVLMSGDPMRAQYIAEHFLTNAKEVTNVRSMLGYTGMYQGIRISVMGHGMGIPSAAIYVTELFGAYNVQTIIRAGSCGAVHPDVNVHDLVIALGASTDSYFNRARFNGHDFAAIADYDLISRVIRCARQQVPDKVRIGNIFSTDIFYTPDDAIFDVYLKMGILGIDMEAAGIYSIAAEYGRKAATICTVSDHLLKKEYLSSKERQIGFNQMIDIALAAIISSQ